MKCLFAYIDKFIVMVGQSGVVGLTQPSRLWMLVSPFLVVKWPQHEAKHSLYIWECVMMEETKSFTNFPLCIAGIILRHRMTLS